MVSSEIKPTGNPFTDPASPTQANMIDDDELFMVKQSPLKGDEKDGEPIFTRDRGDSMKKFDEKKEEEKTEEPRWLGDLIHESFYDKLVIIGFPYDEGAKLAGARKGADYGPGK